MDSNSLQEMMIRKKKKKEKMYNNLNLDTQLLWSVASLPFVSFTQITYGKCLKEVITDVMTEQGFKSQLDSFNLSLIFVV